MTIFVLGAIVGGCASQAPAPQPRQTVTPPETAEHHAPRAEQAHAASQQCLALAMYWEARGEQRAGMLAVGHVVMNRVADPRFPDDVCAVVQQGGETPPCQFSWWCDGKSDRPTDAASWRRSMHLAGQLLAGGHSDETRGALFFHNRSISRPWRYARTASIGNHIFYR